MERSKSFHDVVVWQKAHQFVLGVYKITASFPKSETYGLVSQMRRAAVSIPSNIAEGFAKKGLADKVRFMNIAQGSLEESQYYLILMDDLGYGSSNELKPMLEEVGRMLASYSRAIQEAKQISKLLATSY